MPKPRLPFLHRHVSRHGRVSYYVKLSKREKGRGIRIRDRVFHSASFMDEYHASVRGAPMTPVSTVTKDGKETLGWLIKQYRNSRDWTVLLSAGTKKQRGPILKQVEDAAADIPYAGINRTKIEEGMTARTSNQARHFLNTMRQLFKWAVGNQHHDRNPTDGIKVERGSDDDGHLAWPIEMIEQFEKRWLLGTRQRLVFDIYLYVGLRRGDAARLGKQHIKGGIVHLKTEKSGGTMPIYVPTALHSSARSRRTRQTARSCWRQGWRPLASSHGRSASPR